MVPKERCNLYNRVKKKKRRFTRLRLFRRLFAENRSLHYREKNNIESTSKVIGLIIERTG